MGKKACLALDLGYDSDEYHYEDDTYYYDYHSDEEDVEQEQSSRCVGNRTGEVARASGTAKDNKSEAVHPKRQINPFTVLTPRMAAAKNAQRLLYVPNPHRSPLFTDYIATQDGLLVQVVSFLDMNGVITLSIVSKLLQQSLSGDGLYCSSSIQQRSEGILLPCLQPVAHKLLPIDPERHRLGGISRVFAYECLTFSKSCATFASLVERARRGCGSPCYGSLSKESTFEPNTVVSIKTPEQMNAIAFRNVRWEQPSYALPGKGPSPPPQKSLNRNGIRLSYVTNDANDCALVTTWCGVHYEPRQLLALGPQSQQTKDRYLPPNTRTIVEAAIHSESGLCAILATPLEHYSTERYILSMVALPTIPPGIIRTSKNDLNVPRPDQHALMWQKHLSSNNWHLFSSSETNPIVSFSSQGNYLAFGSTERWGVVDVRTGSHIWSLFDTGYGPSSVCMRSLYATAGTTTEPTSRINTCLVHHEFLFVLERNGTLMRVYDVSNTSSRELLAEGNLPWSFMKTSKEKQAQGLVRLHHTHQQHQRNLRNEFRIAFCAGRVWITGMYNTDLLCSALPRLLRRLRSNLSSASSNDVLSLKFVRIKTDLHLGTPHPLQTWNDAHLYVVDSGRLHCWKSKSPKQITTVLNAGSSFIESIHVDATKIIACTNCTFRNTTTRDWGGSGSIWVIPVDGFEPIGAILPSSPAPMNMEARHGSLELTEPHSYSPILQIYQKRIFSIQHIVGNFITGNSRRPHYPISSSSNSNYQVVDTISDGRYVLVRCKKGSATKTVILDLYEHHNDSS